MIPIMRVRIEITVELEFLKISQKQIDVFTLFLLLQYKMILLGDGTVGKTSIAMRFTNDQFGQQYKQVAACSIKNLSCKTQTWHERLYE